MCVWNTSHSKKNSARYYHVKYPLFLLDFNETWIFSTVFLKILIYQISLKSVPWEPSYSMRTGEQTWWSTWSLFAILQTRLKMQLLRLKLCLVLIFNFGLKSLNHFASNTSPPSSQNLSSYTYMSVSYFISTRYAHDRVFVNSAHTNFTLSDHSNK